MHSGETADTYMHTVSCIE